jgi:hypothetical protein
LAFIRNPLRFTGYLFLILLVGSCDRSGENAGDNEGVIEFQTRAIDETHPLYGFAPDKATLKFKDHRFALEMSTMGMFNMSIMGNTEDSTMAQTIKFMNIKQACFQNAKDLEEENRDFELAIEETQETKKMLGFNCYKLRVSKMNEPDVKFDAWYTKDLGMENSNALTPYAKVKGILLDYRIKKWGMELQFVAKSYKKEQVPDNTFEIPSSMKVVTKEEMNKFFEDLQ